MTTSVTQSQTRTEAGDRQRPCPRCTKVLELDHRTTLGGVFHAACPSCGLHYLLSGDIWTEFGGCQACRSN